MNKKLIAVAVAGAIAGPTIMSAAGADVSVYGALYPRIAVQDGDVTFEDGASRFGFKSSKDMGNGNTVSGVIEVGFDVGNGKAASADKSRLGNVKYSGNWGSILLGSAWSIDGAAKLACVAGSQSCAQVGYQGRVADMIQITGDLGGFSLQGQTEFDGTDGVAAWALATTVGLGSLTLGAVYRDDGTNQTTHLGASTTIAGIYVGAELGDSSNGDDSWGLGVKISGIKIGMDEGSDGNQDLAASYDIDLGGSTLSLRVSDNHPADTVLRAQFNYSL